MIVLSTLNARYIHSSLGLRCLYANMAELREHTELLEFVSADRASDIAEIILSRTPRIVGFGVYIWNVEETTKLVRLLKRVSPDLIIVLGGPEVSHEPEAQGIVAAADYVITGPGDVAFAELCRAVLAGNFPKERLIRANTASLAEIELPYRDYTDLDIVHRLIYVEASRGCPFRCEFCLSSLDERTLGFDLDRFLEAMLELYNRGVRHFKFVDRTFNLKVEASCRILEFFLKRADEGLFLHFELVPDRLPNPLRELIRRFPRGSLQFEIGIQTFNPLVQQRISRRQDNCKTEQNLAWLKRETAAHIHADLIVGLPGESLESFGAGFDRLLALGPDEIQIGILKRLRGAPIARHAQCFQMVFGSDPPYPILRTKDLSFADIQRMTRFARYWDLVANSGRFPSATKLLLEGHEPFRRFLTFTDWLYAEIGKTHQIALDRLFDLVFRALTELYAQPRGSVVDALRLDYVRSGLKRVPGFLRNQGGSSSKHITGVTSVRTARRQMRHAKSRDSEAVLCDPIVRSGRIFDTLESEQKAVLRTGSKERPALE